MLLVIRVHAIDGVPDDEDYFTTWILLIQCARLEIMIIIMKYCSVEFMISIWIMIVLLIAAIVREERVR